MPPDIDTRLKKCFEKTRKFRITDQLSMNIALAPGERVLGVYFNREIDDYSDAFVITSLGLHIFSPALDARFVAFDDIVDSHLHPNKNDQGRDVQYRFVELILKTGERIKVFVAGEYDNGCLELYNLDRFLGYVHIDRRIQSQRKQKEQA